MIGLTWLTLIVITFLAVLFFFLIWPMRYLLTGRKLLYARLAVLAFDIIAIAWFVLHVARYHQISGNAFLLELIVAFVLAQLIGSVFVMLAVLVRCLWRRMMAVPVDESRRRLLSKAAVYPAAAAGLSLYGSFVERDSLVERSYDIPVHHLAEDGYRIAQLSDIHLGAFFSVADLETLLQRAAAAKPNLLAITGDLFDDNAQNHQAARLLERYIDAFPDGIWYCLGNHEHFRGVTAILEDLAHTRVQVLVNECRQIPGRSIFLAGVDYPMDRPHFADLSKEYMEEALEKLPTGAPTVLLAHHPDFIDLAAERAIALTLSGHTHGGQFGILGLPLFPVFKYTRGMVQKGESYGYVHCGNGSWFPCRIGCPPEIAYFNLRAV
ncbi:metallophosphoesterase [Mitsuokella sp. AF21-1AC]|uniref:metallophosphoesterase n=1 Tax=Mitsuokella sp. AF21-1AC TaxID=2292235 RepID=UPI001F45D01B|nr:metallophosphoesterase [Mitsuokella sp. AF21-1AC]